MANRCSSAEGEHHIGFSEFMGMGYPGVVFVEDEPVAPQKKDNQQSPRVTINQSGIGLV
jgi:hypothetical protein